MTRAYDLLVQNRHEELWQMCCGFLDLNIDQFMAIQKQLLMEQIEMLKGCKLGRKIMRGTMPDTIEEFRRQVPLTTYQDYCPELLEQNESVLPVQPLLWVQTSGRSGEYPCKWIPMSERFWQEAGLGFSAVALLSSCKHKGEVAFGKDFKMLYAAAQTPFLTGNVAYKLNEDLGFEFLPSLDESSELSFDERIESGFNQALEGGMDGFFGLAGVLVAISEKIRQGSGKLNYKKLLSRPKILSRLLKAVLKSKIAGRQMLPKDLWSLKIIASVGTDSQVYKERIKEMWGRPPLDVYGNTETGVIATQTWDYKSMVFFPSINFFEFIPEDEHYKWQLDHSYKPRTILLNEVKAGQNYELVITNFHGGIMTRYRIGDMIRVTSLNNEELGINLPQIVFERRADDLIDLGFMRLTERVIWQAIENTDIPYRDWTAHKEVGKTAKLRLYLELKDGYTISEEEVATAVYEKIKKVDDGLYVYRDLESLEKLIDFKPIEVTLLPIGAFTNYKAYRMAEGVDLVHIKPPHVNPTDVELSLLGAKGEMVHVERQIIEDEAVVG